MNSALFISKVTPVALAVLVLCTASCRKPADPAELALEQKQAGPPPSAANILPVDRQPDPLPASRKPQGSAVHSRLPGLLDARLILVAVLVILFFFSVLIFHTLGRRLRQRSLRAHSPTRHVDIWSTHKPPRFLDP